ncbi:MAG: glycosyltransferase [Thermodesulfobacteriota bacterium]|jgi:glycosyltransferase involved in cell wall biosynthesis
MTSPLVSVIVPTYNRSFFVLEAVDSIFKQTFKDFELIVVDDGSIDGTAEALNPYKGRLIYSFQDHQGVSTARNRGIQTARGKWVAFLDDDDLWLPEKLKTQIDFFSKNPEGMICQTQEIWIRNGRRVNPREKHRKYSGDIFAPSLLLCLVSPSAVMIQRELFEQVGCFDETLPACEDYDLWLRISAQFPIFLIDQPLVVKRGGHPDQLSRTTPALDRFRIQSLVKILDSGQLTAVQYNLAFKELKAKCRIYGQGCLKRGREKESHFYLALPERLKKSGSLPKRGQVIR